MDRALNAVGNPGEFSFRAPEKELSDPDSGPEVHCTHHAIQ